MNREVVTPARESAWPIIGFVVLAATLFTLFTVLGMNVEAHRSHVEHVEVAPTFQRCTGSGQFLAFDDDGYAYCMRVSGQARIEAEVMRDSSSIRLAGPAPRRAWPEVAVDLTAERSPLSLAVAGNTTLEDDSADVFTISGNLADGSAHPYATWTEPAPGSSCTHNDWCFYGLPLFDKVCSPAEPCE